MNRRVPAAKTGLAFAAVIGAKAARKQKARRHPAAGVWFGLGMSGLIGWSVAVPTLLGALLGLWLDHRHPSSHSWTLMLLVIGLVIGCANAWHWMDQQNKAMQDPPKDKDE